MSSSLEADRDQPHPSPWSLTSSKKAQSDAESQFTAFSNGLAKSRNQFLYNLEDSLSGGGQNLMDQLEDTLLQADLGMATTDDVLKEARFLREESTDIFSRDDIKAILRGKLLEALGAANPSVGKDEGEDEAKNPFALQFAPPDSNFKLTVHFIMGANGMGKTTTIGKLAHRLKTETGQKVLVAACDTFRAGAVAQLERWAEQAEVDCFSPSKTTNGPSAVLYGALDKAINEEYDVLLVDTSGRLSNNDALTAELVKMKKVIQKRMSMKADRETNKPLLNMDVPHETLLVIDAAQGRMALDSAKQWNKEVGLTGLILTKLDGSAKGGSVVAVSRELGLPVKLVGVGEGMEDLRDFEPESFVDSLIGVGVGGKGLMGGSSKDEGKALESRLNQMRKEREMRAKKAASTTKLSEVNTRNIMDGGGGAYSPTGQFRFPEMDDMEDKEESEMQLITPGEGAGGGSCGKNKNKRKKKKKGKR
mmetsp:Transcript_1852/g.4042  ORF Transcript_1852/g.4042 Transcript_1852/m.4042 type:complete len:477 (+) Transcript_1852:303-1733(+)